MTDKPYGVATLATPTGPAVLVVTCDRAYLALPEPVTYRATVGVNYRFDDRAIAPRIAHLDVTGRDVRLWLGEPEVLQRIAAAKRLRVEVFGAAGRLFMDYDLTGAADAFAGMGCPARR